VPIGVAYRFLNKQKFTFYTHFRFIPSFTLSGNGDITGTGTYDGIIINEATGEVSQMRILRMMAADPNLIQDSNGFGPYEVGENQTISTSTEPELNRLTYLLQISPTAYIKFGDDNPGWGLMIGLDASYRLGSLLTHNPINDISESPFRFSDDNFEGSLLSQYTDNVSALNFGLRIGLFQRLTNEP